jgi:hypothetical protein
MKIAAQKGWIAWLVAVVDMVLYFSSTIVVAVRLDAAINLYRHMAHLMGKFAYFVGMQNHIECNGWLCLAVQWV